MVSTKKDILDKQYKEDMGDLVKECREGRLKLAELLGDNHFVNTAGWRAVFVNRHNYDIAEIQLMGVDTISASKDSPLTFFEQFMLRFHDNETMYIYVKLAEVK